MERGMKKMSNSSLVTYTKISPNKTVMSNKKITHIVIHHMAGCLTIQQCGNVFANKNRQASSNYGVDSDGIGLYVDEKDRAWTTGSREIDQKAVTIEVSNSETGGDWPVSDVALKNTIKLCADICKRNGIKELKFTGDKSGNLHVHRWYQSTLCPGPYLYGKMPYIASEVNKILNGSAEKPAEPSTPAKGKLYRVQVGAYKNLTNAERMRATLKQAGFEAFIQEIDV